ncbi:MAG: hypothetical protein QM638_05750 [Nocardioides sp.]
MDHDIDVVLRQEAFIDLERRADDHFVDVSACLDDGHPLGQRHDWPPLVGLRGLVSEDANDEVATEGPGGSEQLDVACVEQVADHVDVDPCGP